MASPKRHLDESCPIQGTYVGQINGWFWEMDNGLCGKATRSKHRIVVEFGPNGLPLRPPPAVALEHVLPPQSRIACRTSSIDPWSQGITLCYDVTVTLQSGQTFTGPAMATLTHRSDGGLDYAHLCPVEYDDPHEGTYVLHVEGGGALYRPNVPPPIPMDKAKVS